MRKIPVRKIKIFGSFILCFAITVTTGWSGYISYVGEKLDNSCNEKKLMKTESDQDLQQVLESYSLKVGGAGLQATIIYPDGTHWQGTSGFANIEQKCPMTRIHHLYIGSMTKLYTATLIMKQVEVDTISLDDTLDKWVSIHYANQISVKMLLGQRSGIPDYAWDPWFDFRYIFLPGKNWSNDELLDVLRGKPLHFEPGTKYEYSNSNYLMLGIVLEQVTGRSYAELLKELIVDPLNLQDTSYQESSNWSIANGYDVSLLHIGKRNVTGLRKSIVSGASSAGGILSNSYEMACFIQALFTGRIVKEPSLSIMRNFKQTIDEDIPEQTGYGLGIRRLTIGGEQLMGHTGTILGYSSIGMYNPAENYTIVILSNLSTIDQTHLLEELQTIVLQRLEVQQAREK